ncbi:MAG: hypothetical protein UR39_C0003G0011 [Candidatus Woesebacteria bacterium GW2011_GWA1_33_30]|uniref:Uncharacterized protein n=1 Tax=Candidatus Woesebacteria bacterium GW2011_GWA2_33_28 TaxID=1618561 RepID=A0A0F9ZTI9_9BACT|nr:MAG: hypothetical protein UR38_C0003G0013 [Candidatus Woesebacteria bacterium GW2011_GWA2_33_28]KKP48476.1 MAG: hypothetical protein UR39_C0003G0011 [Candidatus Woesebacteria bacterium GW2011_GWA1_33_30]KKP49614.1 MAG: hypothetical protein UR40_C0004G0013 [Microgenomates group bacterium GW2011_GWC1_33_32]KKP52231.1 MAG: hypothetical protein UR44_C0003G0013 [Candidatus Woesebacteria bacterium GW2011_GWB1_33_38]
MKNKRKIGVGVNRLKRKNFLPSLVITTLLWVTLGFLVYFTDPQNQLFVVLFFINLFTTLFFTTALVLGNSRRGLIVSTILTVFSLFRLFGIGNILNFLLLAGLGVIIEFYAKLTKRNN